MSKWLCVIFFSSLIIACGNKGALYLPKSEKNVETISSKN
ncbi:LPS translocon maturation chaperone LptM [Marinomonas algicola]